MSNDNTLGAPTEGLGQTVTFAVNGSGGVPQTQAAQRGAVQNNSTGGGAVRTAQALQVQAARQDPTFEVLAKLGGAMLQPYIEQERTAKYMEGMQKASQGQAITEIVDEQPWYSKLFGSTSLVDGARAYTASTKAMSMAVDMETNMAELRKLPPGDFAKYATDAMMNTRTGDGTTDMMITQQVSATLPSVMKAQAKAHIEYKTEVLGKTLADNLETSFSLLAVNDSQVRAGNGTKEEDDLLGAGIGVLDSMTPPATMPPKTFNHILTQSAVKAVLNGNYAVMNLLEKSKRMDSLSAEEQVAIRTAYRQASQQTRLNVPDSLLTKVDDFRAISSHTDASPEDIYAAGEAINKEYTKLTGDPGQYITNATTLVELEQLRNHQNAEQARLNQARATAATKDGKAAAELAAISNLATRVSSGDSTQTYLMAGETKKEQQEVFDHLRATASPEVRTRVMVQQIGVAIDTTEQGIIEAAISQAKAAGDPSMLADVYYNKYLPLVLAAGDNGETIAQQYAGKYKEDMARYHALAQGRKASEVERGAFYSDVVNPRPKALPSTPRGKEIISELTTGFVMSHLPFTKTPIRDPAGYAAELDGKLHDWLKPKEAIQDAQLNSPTLNLVGGYHWRNNVGATKLTSWLAAAKTLGVDKFDDALELTVKQYSDQAGITSEAIIGQSADRANGEPSLYIKGLGSDGKVRILPFPASDIHKVWATGGGRFTKDDLQFGPKLTFVPPEGMPSPYDSPEKWAEYRKKQALQKAAKQNKVRKQ